MKTKVDLPFLLRRKNFFPFTPTSALFPRFEYISVKRKTIILPLLQL